MKVSLNLAQHFSNVDLKSIPKDELLRRIGAQLGAIEEVIDWAPKYEGVVVVRVVSCEKHPNADKLNVCRIDDGGVVKHVDRGDDGLVQVVCGAPNVHAGMFVSWIPPKATVPASRDTSDPFVLEARELRGVVSNGMLASAAELAISDDHNGLMEIKSEEVGRQPNAGDKLVDYFGLDDLVIDCENKMFTHRPDCFGNLGIAREIAGITAQSFKSPDWYKKPLVTKVASKLTFKSANKIPKLVSRFTAQVIESVKIMNSPVWMQAGLNRVGIRPINNIVDWTNYYMHLTAQPTHAFDYDKIKALSNGDPTLFPRMAQDGEELVLLNGKTIKLTKEDMVISTDKKAVALAGVMGGAETEVDENTKNIIIECATFDMYAVRRTSMRHGLFTDAVTRFNKGQSPLQNEVVLAKIVSDICSQTGGKSGKLYDSGAPDKVKQQTVVSVRPEFINQRLGSSLIANELKELLENVEFMIEIQGETLHIKPPFWRMDIEQDEDIVEEIGRLYGFERLPVALPKKSALASKRNKQFDVKQSIRQALKAAGANEVLTYSFVHGDLITKVGQDIKEAYHIRNALSPDLQYYRLTLTPSLLSVVHPNIKAGYEEFALFELNKTHVRMHGKTQENVPSELDMVALVFAASEKCSKQRDGAAYYQARLFLDEVARNLGLRFRYEKLEEDHDYQVCKPFDWQRSALVYDTETNEFIGQVGEYATRVKRNLKLPSYCAGFEISLEALTKLMKAPSYKVMSKYPETTQDITLEVKADNNLATLETALKSKLSTEAVNHGYEHRLELINIYSEENSEFIRFTFRLILSHMDRTLTTDEANSFIENVTQNLQKTLSVKRI